MSTPGWTEAELHPRDPLRRAGALLGCSTGQAWTLLLGAALGALLLGASVQRGPGVPRDAASTTVPPALLAPAPGLPDAPAGPEVSASPPAPAAPPSFALPALAFRPGLPAPGFALDRAAAPAMAFGPPPAVPVTAPSAGPRQPLGIREGGWYARFAAPVSQGRGFASSEYPVGADATGDNRHSFVRLTGTTTTLVLAVDPASTATYGRSLARLQACPTLDRTWRPVAEQPTAPAYASSGCAPGAASPDGSSWSFNLSLLPDPTGAAGVTLVADLSAPVSGAFQITFLPSIGATP